MTIAHTHTIHTDSQVFKSGQGYERILIVADWHPTEPRTMAQVHIRVDRNPENSFANISIWTKDSGWQIMGIIPPNSFWSDMPGYLRWSNDTSDSKTMKVADTLVTDLVYMARDGLI